MNNKMYYSEKMKLFVFIPECDMNIEDAIELHEGIQNVLGEEYKTISLPPGTEFIEMD
ncbi:hypothetical protein [Staphylococcus xylosus]|uniref:hypothetical protein n=1 Tax=Staphylococcus xylosus TaxID=1288 RepID=UPI0015C525FC|nr:hypothetical protein [Staphylococcus xylosus]NQD99775.1 hypothetical protein [Staphylococcus xylosus]